MGGLLSLGPEVGYLGTQAHTVDLEWLNLLNPEL